MKLYFLSICFSLILIRCAGEKEASQAENSTAFYENKSLASNQTTIEKGNYRISKVSDGDTFWCTDMTGKRIKIRLIGIDAPEPRSVFNKKEQPFGKESSAIVKKFLLNKQVRLEFDVDSLDQFGRTLAYAFLKDGTFINEYIVRNGLAIVSTYPPNIKYESIFIQAQQEARKNNAGLWAVPMK